VNQIEIRHAHASDLPYLYDICHRTGYVGQDASDVIADRALLGQYFAAPYAVFNPDWCWIAVDAEGPVGYLVTTPDSRRFVSWMNTEWLPRVRSLYAPQRPGAHEFEAWLRGFIHESAAFPDFVDQYPAHLHIDFLPRAQGRGLGTKVVALFEQKLRENGVAGFHLGMGEKNARAGQFYEKLGLTLIRHDPGVIFYGRRV
jgi:GNAT superfamily N-acetyltransferase